MIATYIFIIIIRDIYGNLLRISIMIKDGTLKNQKLEKNFSEILFAKNYKVIKLNIYVRNSMPCYKQGLLQNLLMMVGGQIFDFYLNLYLIYFI